jgi:Rne/Rng family ribonuclease
MNKELFVSSTPHETKVGLVEDDLLAEVYLERENEYTLAGSIYKGRVTRVLPGMQSAFVDIGLERDAFLYVSDFLDLEDHDEDLTETVPTDRGVQDMRPQPVSTENSHANPSPVHGSAVDEHEAEGADDSAESSDADTDAANARGEGQESSAQSAENSAGRDQDRGGYRGRRRRRGGRRDGRDRSEGRDRNNDRDRNERSAESRTSAPVVENVPAAIPPRVQEPSRTQFGPPAGYEPMILPGESLSKYRGKRQPAAEPVHTSAHEDTHREDVRQSQPAHPARYSEIDQEQANEPSAPVAATFPEDEPIFASPAVAQASAEPHEVPAEVRSSETSKRESHPHSEEHQPTEASTTVDWNREFHRMDSASAVAAAAAAQAAQRIQEVIEEVEEVAEEGVTEETESAPDHRTLSTETERVTAFAAPGTLEEEVIDDEEADTVRYEQSSDEGYEEFEEETQAAGPNGESRRVFSDVRMTVDEIHNSSLAESGVAHAEGTEAGTEEDSEELELEEAQAEAEAMLDAEARGNGTVDARAEVRASTGTAGLTQRSPRQRPTWERRGGGRRAAGGRRFPRRQQQDVPKISDLLKEGQEILVQIAKEPIGKKGARITSHIALPGRFLVYMPTVNHTGVSRKIASDEERQRLKRIVMSERENGHGGFIVRTAAQSASEEELRADIRFLKGLWNDIKTRAEASKPPALIYHDLNVVERVLRDQVTSDFSVIWVDTEPEYERILRFFNRFQPGLVKRVKLFTKETPLFEQFGLKEEMDKALKSKVWLKSGGYIVINQTEALVAIDINTGKYVGKTSRLEDTIVKTNVDAIKEIVRQIRLRDLGGIIIIDFIDMDERRNRQRVMQALEEELRHDRAPSKVLQFNDFGLVAITRKRVKQSLERTIGAPCPYCQSTGYIKSLTTVANEIYVEMRKMAKHLEQHDVMLRVHPDVAKELKGNNGRLLNEMEELTKRTIIVKSDPALHQEQFDIN